MNKNDLLPVLKAKPSDIPDKILVVGDPARVDRVLSHLSHSVEVSHNREYRVARGVFHPTDARGGQGVAVGVVSHGVGAAGAAVCFEELCRAGATTIIRAGTAGGMQDHVAAGDLVIPAAAVREDSLSHKLVPESYPAIATPGVLLQLRKAAQSAGRRHHDGLVLTLSLFYPHAMLGSELPRWQKLPGSGGITAVDMECATLFVICSLNQVATGAVLAIDGNPLLEQDESMANYNPDQEEVLEAVDQSIQIALHGLCL